jgi:hypothetical protein
LFDLELIYTNSVEHNGDDSKITKDAKIIVDMMIKVLKPVLEEAKIRNE